MESSQAFRSREYASVKHQNALQSLVWLNGLTVTPCIVIATRVTGNIQVFLLILAAVPLCLFGFAYLWLLFTDPDRLQSEQFQLREHALDIIEGKGDDLKIKTVDLVAMTNNPYPESLKQIGSKGESQ